MTNTDRFDLISKTSSKMAESLARLEKEARREGVMVDFGIYYQLLGYIQGLCICGEEETPEPLEPSFIDLDEYLKEKASEKLYKGKNDMHLAEEEE